MNDFVFFSFDSKLNKWKTQKKYVFPTAAIQSYPELLFAASKLLLVAVAFSTRRTSTSMSTVIVWKLDIQCLLEKLNKCDQNGA